MFAKPATTQQTIIDELALRWSGRAYDPTRTVPRDHITALLEAARWAPSCYGDQPWRFIIWNKANHRETWMRAFRCLAQGNQEWAENAPLLMAALADTEFERNGKPNRWGAYDTGAASMSLAVQATALGLMVHQMGGFDADALRQAFAIPARFQCMAMMTVGYQLPEERIPAEAHEREHGERSRAPLVSRFFEGNWQQGFQP